MIRLSFTRGQLNYCNYSETGFFFSLAIDLRGTFEGFVRGSYIFVRGSYIFVRGSYIKSLLGVVSLIVRRVGGQTPHLSSFSDINIYSLETHTRELFILF